MKLNPRNIGPLLSLFCIICIILGASTARAASPGSVVAWGYNAYGQLNVPVAAQSGIVAIASGWDHPVALKIDGSVVAWGRNDFDETTVPAAAQSGVVAVAGGFVHTVALKNDGSVVAWGQYWDGSSYVTMTVPAGLSGVMAIAGGSDHAVALKNDGSVVAWGWNSHGQTDVPIAAQSGVVAIAAGHQHTLALKNDGSVVAWGAGATDTGITPHFGQCIVPVAAQTGVTAIAAGQYHTVVLKNNGSVIAWGYNVAGQTTVPVAAQSGVTAIAAGGIFTLALKNNGSVVAWGDNSQGQASVPLVAQTGVIAIAAGGNHSVALVRTDSPDTTPPLIICPANITSPCSAALLAGVTFTVTATDDADPSPTVTCTPPSGSGFPIGATEVYCTATDASGNFSHCSFTVTRAALGFAGFLSPIGGADATGGSFARPLRSFKMGSTIPVKFTASCSGSKVATGVHRLQAVKHSNATTSAAPIDVTPQDATTAGNQFRFVDGQWHFNVDTKATGMSTGIWQFTATLSDGSQHAVWIQLK